MTALILEEGALFLLISEIKCLCVSEPEHCQSSIKNLVLRTQSIQGLNDAEIWEEILQSKEISLDDCYQLATAMEASKIDTPEAYRNSKSNVNRISFLKQVNESQMSSVPGHALLDNRDIRDWHNTQH